MEITGRVFHINAINDKVAQVVLRKRVNGKDTPIALTVIGYWRDVVINEMRLKKNDKIRGTVVLKSKLYNGKYYTDVTLKNIELISEKPKEQPDDGQISFIPNHHIVDEETGEILL